MKLSVIIVNYNVRYFLEQCLLSVISACDGIGSEIIVVDNNSTDGSCSMIKKLFPHVKLIENKTNTGFSKANNQGVKQAKGEYILILNPDTLLGEDSIKKALAFAYKKEKMGAIGVKMIDGTGKYLPESKRNIPTIQIAAQKILGKSKKYYASFINENQTSKVDVITGAFMLMKRKVFNDVGGFDESYFMYGEDIDLCYTLIKKGFINYYLGKIKIIHYKGESTVKNTAYLKIFYGAMLIFYKNHYSYNLVSKLILKGLVKWIVFVNSFKIKNIRTGNKKCNSVFYLGDKSKILDILKNKFGENEIEYNNLIPKDIQSYDCIIFDNNQFSNKEIIDKIHGLNLFDISKRIIPKNCNFFIGSDFSIEKGAVAKF